MRFAPCQPLTTRRLMILVAVFACGLYVVMTVGSFLYQIVEDFDEPFGLASTITKSWDLGPTPRIVVDSFEGTIAVSPSTDGRVSAQITSHVLAQDHKAAAVAGLKSIRIDYAAHDDTLRIVARGASEGYAVWKSADVDLFVPPNVHLDLRTGRGSIQVGRSLATPSTSPARPIVIATLRARNDSRYRDWNREGDIEVVTKAPVGADGTPAPTRLQLEAPGRITIAADLAVVDAYAWHGKAPTDLPNGLAGSAVSPEGGDEGTIRFDGTFAGERNSLRAAHELEVNMPASAAVRVNAVSRHDTIRTAWEPQSVIKELGASRWSATIGAEPRTTLDLQADDGRILIGVKP